MAKKSYIREMEPHYRSGLHKLKDDFFDPCLNSCSFYYRASGYFSSSALRTWINILPRLANQEDIDLKLLVSPELSARDKEALARAVDPDTSRKILDSNIDEMIAALLENDEVSVDVFSWLVASGRLVLKFAFPSHIETPHIFHEKYGIFGFPWGDRLAFIGSANETASGHAYNYESVDVYRGWIDAEDRRIDQKLSQFEEAWDGDASGLTVRSLTPDALRFVCTRAENINNYPQTKRGSMPVADEAVENKWRHQDEAIKIFIEAKSGILEMATGTGKTRVAMRTIKNLVQSGEIDSVIICTIGNDLMDQWYKELLSFLIDLDMGFFRHYGSNHEMNRYLGHPRDSILIVSRSSLKGVLHGLPGNQKAKTLVVHDEVHGFGSPANIRDLRGAHDGVVYRMGLSATPDREYDEDGTEFILNEIGEVVYNFGLEEAIARGILCEFDYFPLEYHLTESDRIRLRAVYQRKAARLQEGKPMSDAELFRELSNVYKTAAEKPAIFREYIRKNPEILQGAIVFTHTKQYGLEAAEAIHEITEKYSTYFDDDHVDRLKAFGKGDLDCLVTCHRVSQGIDIRHLRSIVLLSSDRVKLETIQRIGRCLRTDPNDPDKRAVVVDFVREKEEGKKENADDVRRQWLQKLSECRRNVLK